MREDYMKAFEKYGQKTVEKYLNAGWSINEINQGYAILRVPVRDYIKSDYINNLDLRMIILQPVNPFVEVVLYYHHIDKLDQIKADENLLKKLRLIDPNNYYLVYPIKCEDNDKLYHKLNGAIKVYQFVIESNYKNMDYQLKDIYELTESHKEILLDKRQGIIDDYMPEIDTDILLQDMVNDALLESFSAVRMILNKSCEFVAIQFLYSKEKPTIEQMKDYIESSVNYIKENILPDLEDDLEEAETREKELEREL